MNRRRYHLLDFATEVNAAVVGDLAKLIMHRLVARRMRLDSSLVERAKKVQAKMAEQYGGWPFIAEWNELLAMPPAALRAKLISRDREMVRLRNTSPFYLTEGIDFGDYDHRIRIARAARRVAQRSIVAEATRQRDAGGRRLGAGRLRLPSPGGGSVKTRSMPPEANSSRNALLTKSIPQSILISRGISR
jgi:hypothetical protein